MVRKSISCPTCQSTAVVKYGQTAAGKQRFRWQSPLCSRQTFLLEYVYKGRLPEVKQQSVDLALHGSGIRDTARVLHISPTTGIET
jgi:transposase-like protein